MWCMYGPGQGCLMGGGMMMLFAWAAFIWFIVFTILVVLRLDKIVKLLEKK